MSEASWGWGLDLVGELLCEREATSLSSFAHSPWGFGRVFRQCSSPPSSSIGAGSPQTRPRPQPQSRGSRRQAQGCNEDLDLSWGAASPAAAAAFAQVCIERLDDARAGVRIEALRALFVAALALPGGCRAAWLTAAEAGEAEAGGMEKERQRAHELRGDRVRAEVVLEEVGSVHCLHLLLHCLCRAARFGSREGEHEAEKDEVGSAEVNSDDGLDDSEDEDEEEEGWSDGEEAGEQNWDYLCEWGVGQGAEAAGVRGARQGQERALRVMRVEMSCICNLMFLALSHRYKRALGRYACQKSPMKEPYYTQKRPTDRGTIGLEGAAAAACREKGGHTQTRALLEPKSLEWRGGILLRGVGACRMMRTCSWRRRRPCQVVHTYRV